jgi:hypothetical protein
MAASAAPGVAHDKPNPDFCLFPLLPSVQILLLVLSRSSQRDARKLDRQFCGGESVTYGPRRFH